MRHVHIACIYIPTGAEYHNHPPALPTLSNGAHPPHTFYFTLLPRLELAFRRHRARHIEKLSDEETSVAFARALQVAADIELTTVYDVHEELGKGALATVHRVTHKATKQDYAVKMIQKEQLVNCAGSMISEIELMSRIKHPNVIKIVDLFETEDTLYIVSELLSGGELFDHIAGTAEGFSEQMASWYMKSILQALAYLHAMEIVHRDVKPENLLFVDKSADSELRLVDFGIARHLPALDLTKTMAGTPNYIAPEVVMCARGDVEG